MRRRGQLLLDVSEWPQDRTAKRVIFHDQGPDRLGRRHFTLLWWQVPGHADMPTVDGMAYRGQCFFSTQWRDFAPGHS